MQEKIIDLIEPTPEPKSRACRLYAWVLMWLLRTGSILIALITWYLSDYFFAIAAFLVGYVVMGIVRSKLRNSVIPLTQQEYHYSDEAIAKWFVQRAVCFEPEA